MMMDDYVKRLDFYLKHPVRPLCDIVWVDGLNADDYVCVAEAQMCEWKFGK